MIFGDIALFPQQASTSAAQVDWLFLYLLTVTGSVTLLVACLMVYFSIRYRRRPGDVGNPPETHASHALEWFWTFTPLVFFTTFFLWGAEVYFTSFGPPPNAETIYVVGKQWMWKFQHPEGQREIDSLHVPVGRPVRLLMTSEDVIHSLFIPDFRIHMDLLPERYTSVWFQATKPGTYRLFCSQFCGTQHSGMIGTVIAMEPADYDNWLHQGAEGSLALEGRKVFLKYKCNSCHSATAGAIAPVLENIFGKPVLLNDGRTVTADEFYIRESIVNPSAKVVMGYDNIMTPYRGEISEEEIFALIAWLRALKPGETPARVEQSPPPSVTPPINAKENPR